MKKFLIVVAVAVLVGGGAYVAMRQRPNEPADDKTSETNNDGGRRVGAPEQTENTTPGKLKAANFTGPLEEVNTGCFADGECYAVVGGKHITTIMGWSRETVGSVQGVEGFGDLQNFIGKEVEVYAQDKGDGTYTLYGSEGFYLKLK